jgi:hypothetical protein
MIALKSEMLVIITTTLYTYTYVCDPENSIRPCRRLVSTREGLVQANPLFKGMLARYFYPLVSFVVLNGKSILLRYSNSELMKFFSTVNLEQMRYIQGGALNRGLFFADPPPSLLGAVSGKISKIR